jgi:hypothetical protein
MALDRVAGYSAAEIETVMTQALQDHLAVGVTTVRDLGDREFAGQPELVAPPAGCA